MLELMVLASPERLQHWLWALLINTFLIALAQRLPLLTRAGWIHAGGAHHTGYSYAVTAEMLEDFATIAGIEFVRIGEGTEIPAFKQELRTNEVYYYLAQGFRA